MKCKICGTETEGTSVYHPMMNPPAKFHPDVCSNCVHKVIESEDWSIVNLLNNEKEGK